MGVRHYFEGPEGPSGSTTIADGSIANVKLADVATATIKGRATAGTGVPEDLTPAQARTILNVAEGANNYTHPNHTGDVTSSGDGATTIATGAVTEAKCNSSINASLDLADSAVQPAREVATANSLTGGGDLSTNRTLALVGDTASPGNNKVYGTDGSGTRGWKDDPAGGSGLNQLTGDVTAGPGTGSQVATIADDAVTNAKAANMAEATIKGRAAASGTGDPVDLTPTQARTILNVADGATANATNAELRDRATHTGTQTASTISDFDAEVANNSAVAANTAKQTNATHTGDVTGATVLTIAEGVVSNPKLADMATATIKGRTTAGTGAPEDLTGAQALAIVGAPPTTREVATANSLTGGGDLSTNRTLALVGDTASPGNNKVYGTDGTGTRGWKDDPAGGGGAGTKTIAKFAPRDNQPPAANFATLDTRNSIAVLDFDDTTQESAVFLSVIPEAAVLTSGIAIRIAAMATSATTGNYVLGAQIERCNTDLDADSFDTATEATTATNATSGIPTVTTITLTDIDGVTAGDTYRIKVYRKAADAADTMTGDLELLSVEARTAN